MSRGGRGVLNIPSPFSEVFISVQHNLGTDNTIRCRIAKHIFCIP
jgi:hypothetical protein